MLLDRSSSRLPLAGQTPKVVITSYAMLRVLEDDLVARRWGMLVLDESHTVSTTTASASEVAQVVSSLSSFLVLILFYFVVSNAAFFAACTFLETPTSEPARTRPAADTGECAHRRRLPCACLHACLTSSRCLAPRASRGRLACTIRYHPGRI